MASNNTDIKPNRVSILSIKELLKSMKLMPTHITGNVVSKISQTVMSGRTLLTDNQTFSMMGGDKEDDGIYDDFGFSFVEFMEFISLVGFSCYGSLTSSSSSSGSRSSGSGSGGGSSAASWHDLQATNDQRKTLQVLLLKFDQSFLESHENDFHHEGDSIPLAIQGPPGLNDGRNGGLNNGMNGGMNGLLPKYGGSPPGISRSNSPRMNSRPGSPSVPSGPSTTPSSPSLSRKNSSKFRATDNLLKRREMLTREDQAAEDRFNRVQEAFTSVVVINTKVV